LITRIQPASTSSGGLGGVVILYLFNINELLPLSIISGGTIVYGIGLPFSASPFALLGKSKLPKWHSKNALSVSAYHFVLSYGELLKFPVTISPSASKCDSARRICLG